MKKHGARSRGALGRGAAGGPSGRPAWAWELSLPGAADAEWRERRKNRRRKRRRRDRYDDSGDPTDD